MEQNKLIELIIYGYATERMSIELSRHTAPVERTRIANEILANIRTYMTHNLNLADEHIYIYVESEFRLLKNFTFRHLGQLHESLPLVIVFTDLNLKEHAAAQRKIFRDLGLAERPDSELMLHSAVTEPANGSFARSMLKSKAILIEQAYVAGYTLTQGIGTRPIDDGPNQYVYSSRRLTGPFSTAKYFITAKDRLFPPIYFDAPYIAENYNYAPHVSSSREFKAFEINDKGELVLTDKKILESARGVLKEIIGKASLMLLKGQGLVRMSLPVRMFEPASQVEKFADFFAALDYVHQARKETDAVARLQNVICAVCSNFFYGIGARKPFNPYLGETLQGEFAEGTRIYIEHLQHDPPVDAILLVNESEQFRVHGKFETSPKLKTNEITIAFKGVVTFEVGGEFIYAEMAHMVNSGLVYGDRKLKLKDSFYFYYPKAGLKAFVKVGPNSVDKKYDVLTGGIYAQPTLVNFDSKTLGEFIFPDKDAKKHTGAPLVDITGSWLSSIRFNNVEMWSQKQSVFKMQIDSDPLPSDWRFREDLLWMLYDDFKMADAWKLKLEEMQRNDRKNRDNFSKAIKKGR